MARWVCMSMTGPTSGAMSGATTSRLPPSTRNHGRRARSRVLSNRVGNVGAAIRAWYGRSGTGPGLSAKLAP